MERKNWLWGSEKKTKTLNPDSCVHSVCKKKRKRLQCDFCSNVCKCMQILSMFLLACLIAGSRWLRWEADYLTGFPVDPCVCVCVCLLSKCFRPNTAGPATSEIEASASMPLRLQPNGTPTAKLTHEVGEKGRVDDVNVVPGIYSAGGGETGPQPLLVEERDWQKVFLFVLFCPLLYPLKLPWPLHMSTEMLLSFCSSFIFSRLCIKAQMNILPSTAPAPLPFARIGAESSSFQLYNSTAVEGDWL